MCSLIIKYEHIDNKELGEDLLFLSLENDKLCIENKELSIKDYLPKDNSIAIDCLNFDKDILKISFTALVTS